MPTIIGRQSFWLGAGASLTIPRGWTAIEYDNNLTKVNVRKDGLDKTWSQTPEQPGVSLTEGSASFSSGSLDVSAGDFLEFPIGTTSKVVTAITGMAGIKEKRIYIPKVVGSYTLTFDNTFIPTARQFGKHLPNKDQLLFIRRVKDDPETYEIEFQNQRDVLLNLAGTVLEVTVDGIKTTKDLGPIIASSSGAKIALTDGLQITKDMDGAVFFYYGTTPISVTYKNDQKPAYYECFFRIGKDAGIVDMIFEAPFTDVDGGELLNRFKKLADKQNIVALNHTNDPFKIEITDKSYMEKRLPPEEYHFIFRQTALGDPSKNYVTAQFVSNYDPAPFAVEYNAAAVSGSVSYGLSNDKTTEIKMSALADDEGNTDPDLDISGYPNEELEGSALYYYSSSKGPITFFIDGLPTANGEKYTVEVISTTNVTQDGLGNPQVFDSLFTVIGNVTYNQKGGNALDSTQVHTWTDVDPDPATGKIEIDMVKPSSTGINSALINTVRIRKQNT